MNTAWAEEAAPVSAPSGKTGGGSGSTGEHQVGLKDGGKGGEEMHGRGAPSGEDHAGLKHNGIESSPIDARITVVGRPQFGHALNARDQKKTKIARPAAISDHHRALFHSNKNNVVRNAIGLPTPRMKADGKGTDKKSLGTTPVEGSTKNAGAVENDGGIAGEPDPWHQGSVPLQPRDGRLHELPLNAALNRSIINGAGMGRPGMRIGAIGGATKNVPGV